MNLFTCTECGIVLNKDYIYPEVEYDEDLEVNIDKMDYSFDDPRPVYLCPVCKKEFTEEKTNES